MLRMKSQIKVAPPEQQGAKEKEKKIAGNRGRKAYAAEQLNVGGENKTKQKKGRSGSLRGCL